MAKFEKAKGKGDELLTKMVGLTNEYKKFVELDLIFDSPNDFLYRQKGQLKVDNTVLEEFLPRLADVRLIPGLGEIPSVVVGPME